MALARYRLLLAFLIILWPMGARARGQSEARRTEHELYRAQMTVAEYALRAGEFSIARTWLNETTPDRRGFEWRLLDASLDESLATITLGEVFATAIEVSPNSKHVAVGLSNGSIEIRSLADHHVLLKLDGHQSALTDIQYSPNGQRLVSASFDRKVKVWDAATGKLLIEYSGHAFPVGGAAFSPDGKQVVSCAYDRPEGGVVGVVHVWNAVDGKQVRTFDGGAKPLVALAISADGRRVAAASWDFCVFVWPIDGGEPTKLAIPKEGIYNACDGVAFSPDGTLVAGCGKDRTARIWQAETGQLVATLRGHTDAVEKLAFAPDGKTIATAGDDGTVRLWNVADGSARAVLKGHGAAVVDVRYTTDGSRLVSSGRDRTLRIWDTGCSWYGGVKVQATHAAYVARFSPRGERLATCSYDGRIQLWSTATWDLLAAWQAHAPDQSCHALDWLPDGRLLASGSYDKTVCLWDTATLTEVARFEHPQGVYYLRVSPDGRQLAANGGNTVTVWDVPGRKQLHVFQGHMQAVLTVVFSPDGRRIVSAGRDGKAIAWDADTGKVSYTIAGSGPNIADALFTPDGKRIVVVERGGTVTLHDSGDGSLVRLLAHHRHGMDHIALAPDGARVAIASDLVGLIDLASGGIVGSLRPHTDRPFNVDFDNRGERLASCSTDRSIAIADTRPLRERLPQRDAARTARTVAERKLRDRLAAGETLASIADRTWSDKALPSVEQAAWIEAVTAAAAARIQSKPDATQDPKRQ